MKKINQLKTSVAMATYNGEKYIEEQLESIRTQSRPVDEVIIVDDCSTDNTAEIIRGFINKHDLMNWKLFLRTQNQGCTKNFREALRYTSGDIIFFSDQDDMWMNNKVAKMTDAMESDRSILALASSYFRADENLNPLWVKRTPFAFGGSRIYCKVRNSALVRCTWRDQFIKSAGPGCALAVTRSIVDAYLKLPNLIYPHDFVVEAIAGLQGGLYYLNTPLISHRCHSTNISRANTTKPKYILPLAQRIRACEAVLAKTADLQDIIRNLPEIGQSTKDEADRFIQPVLDAYELRILLLREKQWRVAAKLLPYAIFLTIFPRINKSYRLHSWLLDIALLANLPKPAHRCIEKTLNG